MLEPFDVIEGEEVPGQPNLFVIGAYDTRITFYSQQVRSLELIHALKPVEGRPHVAVFGGGSAGITATAALAIDPRTLPNLRHTKVLDAAVAGQPVPKANWNLLLEQMLRLAMKSAGSVEEIRQLCPVNMVKGRKEDE
jgi:hypothetical protein